MIKHTSEESKENCKLKIKTAFFIGRFLIEILSIDETVQSCYICL